jgi:hypothetical protein
MVEHKKGESSDGSSGGSASVSLGGLSTRALRARRRRLVSAVPELSGYLDASVQEQSRRCGKPGCRCVDGDLHGPYLYLSMLRAAGGRRLVYVPGSLADRVGEQVTLSERVQAVLGEISAINLELLARREPG